MTTYKLFGGDLGLEEMMIRCDLSQAAAPIEMNYCNDDDIGWETTQFQCADARHTVEGLITIGKRLAAQACAIPEGEFECEYSELN